MCSVLDFLSPPPTPHCYLHRKLVARIDTDGDSLVSHSELVDWLMRVEESYYQKETLEEWQRGDKDGDRFVTFEEYTESFGFPGEGSVRREGGRNLSMFALVSKFLRTGLLLGRNQTPRLFVSIWPGCYSATVFECQ